MASLDTWNHNPLHCGLLCSFSTRHKIITDASLVFRRQDCRLQEADQWPGPGPRGNVIDWAGPDSRDSRDSIDTSTGPSNQ